MDTPVQAPYTMRADRPPVVTVLMSVYNGMPFLPRSIDSILAQSFADFEFLIIDDGSSDESGAVLSQYARRDARIRLETNATNRGLIACLNQGLEWARGEWVARQDQDNLSLPERLARQVRYLQGRPRVGALGTWLDWIDAEGGLVDRFRPPTSHSLIEWELLFRSAVGHPSAMFRASLARELAYRSHALHAEDYDLWVRLRRRAELANLPEVLVLEYFHPAKTTIRHHDVQERTVHSVQREYLSEVLEQPLSLARVEQHRRLSEGIWNGAGPREIHAQARFLFRLWRCFLRRQGNRLTREERRELRQDLGRRLVALAAGGAALGLLARARLAWRGIRISSRLPDAPARRQLLRRCLPAWIRRLRIRGRT